MLHIVRLIERRHPAARRLVPLLVTLLSVALAAGIAIALLR